MLERSELGKLEADKTGSLTLRLGDCFSNIPAHPRAPILTHCLHPSLGCSQRYSGTRDASYYVWLSLDSGDPNSGPHACLARALPTESSPHPAALSLCLQAAAWIPSVSCVPVALPTRAYSPYSQVVGHSRSVWIRGLLRGSSLGWKTGIRCYIRPWWPPSVRRSAHARGPAGFSLPSVYMQSPWEGRARFCPCFSCALVNGISLFSVERENVQKRTFTRWINLHLEKASGGLGAGE